MYPLSACLLQRPPFHNLLLPASGYATGVPAVLVAVLHAVQRAHLRVGDARPGAQQRAGRKACDARGPHRLGYDRSALLQAPAQQHLRRLPAQLLRHLDNGGVAQQVATPQAGIRHHRHAVLLAQLHQLPALPAWVQLELVDHGRHLSRSQQLGQVVRLVVAHPDSLERAPPVALLQHAPRLQPQRRVAWGGRVRLGRARPVDERQVHVFAAQPGHHGLARGARLVGALLVG
mmetsp:Transcript_19789/g.50234  ORF Transcript_19789/g.50234 Transcript_19789/m.50234 type:complete len:232 (-) Transcript_19789:394-1089(-)